MTDDQEQLLRIKFNYKLFVNVLAYIFAARKSDNAPAHLLLRSDLKPARAPATRCSLECILDMNIRAASLLHSDLIADLDLEAGDVNLATVDGDVAVAHKLARLRARCCVAEAIY